MFGHQDKIKLFKKLVDGDNLGHAYLFFGDSQIGKALFAKMLGYYFEYGEFEITDKPLVDVKLLASQGGESIGIDAVREIKDFLWQTPLCSKKKLAIIDGAEFLTPEAQSSLLKIVEEPPQHALLIFIAGNTQVLLPPLISRLGKIYFKRLRLVEIEKALTENFGVKPDMAKKIAVKSFGKIGLAIELAGGAKAITAVGAEESLTAEIEKKIITLREQNVVLNAGKISRLLQREVLIKRFNVNENLQRKAL